MGTSEHKSEYGGSGDHKGGWDGPHLGTNDQGEKVTASFGSGSNSGQTLAARGWKSPSSFYGTKDNKGHNHYGLGDKDKDRGQY